MHNRLVVSVLRLFVQLSSAGSEKMEASEIKSIEISLSYNLTAANYVSKIDMMRQENAATWCRNRPVLPTVVDEKDPGWVKKLTWYDIVLVFNDGKSRVRLRIRRDHLYLQGFSLNNDGKWFELGNKHLIAEDSTLLGYGHNYNDLLRVAGIETTAGLTGVTFGRQNLMNAAQWLQNPPNDKKRPEALLIVIGMFCESSKPTKRQEKTRSAAHCDWHVL
ncbi:protein synthesis inhibitor I-like [Asparagus officinalis]|nr:protein synthesis inhibitor I-like [Asparagus officinalis]